MLDILAFFWSAYLFFVLNQMGANSTSYEGDVYQFVKLSAVAFRNIAQGRVYRTRIDINIFHLLWLLKSIENPRLPGSEFITLIYIFIFNFHHLVQINRRCLINMNTQVNYFSNI
ncbi:Hypothetical_protein [Hexamita inflata]|uniref:Hypothetical_protein n=1 Tax=Hexamita inflata TaxID=28002 RepID=A0AA86UCG3_9EUKA|nr:Hypothetical protein HINF_LOCUS40185 [Hexamita inflata]